MRELFKQLQIIEVAKGSNKKKELLKELCKNKDHKAILEMALDPRFPMYLGKEAKFEAIDPECEEHDEKSMQVVMTNLNNGVIGRGGPAHETINGVIGSFYPWDDERHIRTLHVDEVHGKNWAMKWIPRLVTKDLQIGISWSTFKAVNGEKKFAVMLAKDINKIKNIEKKFSFPVYVQPKLDGYRAIANAEGDHELRSRNGKLYENFPTIVEALKEACPDYMLLDGEIMSDDFQAMQKTAFRQDGETVGDVSFHVFDAVDRGEWEKGEGIFTFEERYDSIMNLLYTNGDPRIKIVETHECNSWEAVYELHAEFLEKGYEGTMVRADKPYQFKRTDFLAKIKEMQSMDCEVIGIEEGRNSFEGTMGHVIVKQENGVECGVGSGFTRDKRDHVWAHEDLYVGRKAEIKYQELTKDGVMRFPVFVRWRDDK